MCVISEEAIAQFEALMEQVDEALKTTFQNIHQGCTRDAYLRFLTAREGNVANAHKMLVDSLTWRVENEIDDILAKPIIPTELYRAIRDSQLIGMPGYTKEGLPIFAFGAGLSTYDKASVHYYVQSHIQINEYRDRVVLPAASKKNGKHISKSLKVLDMTGLKLSALNQIKLLTIISSIDDLNYPEKVVAYYIVNAPYIFSACWKERTRKKVQVLSGCGQDDLLKIMDYSSLPHFCRREGSGSSRYSGSSNENCYSLDHPFHLQLYDYIKQQALLRRPVRPVKQGSVHVDFPDAVTEGTEFVQTLASEFQKFGKQNGLAQSLDDLNINDHRA
ncbi:hypothetical protein AABB24_019222 [Solanum stoloniferum]|uniref:CRAL-TRIO domain-containing protein n=1 Tax=Solanum stoloniferum TaxID=62892 RepID=A0ABD2THA8_9SOLN